MSVNNNDGQTLEGQRIVGPMRLPVTFTREDMVVERANALLGDRDYEIEPLDIKFSRVEHTTLTAEAIAEIEGAFTTAFGRANIDFPPVLTDLDVVFEEGGGDGDYLGTGSVASGGTGGSISDSASVQASAYSVPKLVPKFFQAPRENLPITRCFFFVAKEDAGDKAIILARLTADLGATVLDWPIFSPQSLVFLLSGQRAAAAAKGSAHMSGSASSYSEVSSFGYGKEVAPSIETLTLAPTLHGTFTLDATSTNSETSVFFVSMGVVSASGSAVASATSVVSPTAIAATSPTGLPTTGLYLYGINFNTEEFYGYLFAEALVFDFSVLPTPP